MGFNSKLNELESFLAMKLEAAQKFDTASAN